MTALQSLPTAVFDISQRAAIAPPAEKASLRRVLVAADAAAAGLSWAVALSAIPVRPELAAASAVLVVALAIALASWQELYLARACAIRSVENSRLARVAALVGLASLLLAHGGVQVSPARAAAAASGHFALASLFRSAYGGWLRTARRSGQHLRSVVVVGTNEEAQHLVRLIETHPETGLAVAGVVGDPVGFHFYGFGVPLLGPVSKTAEALTRTGANGVVIAVSAIDACDTNELTRDLLERGVHVRVSTGIRGVSHSRLRAQPLAHEPIVYVEPLRLERWQMTAKRAVDLVGGAFGLLLSLPVLLMAALLIKLEDGGPVFFRQSRIGKDCEPFTIWKLRTMATDAEARYQALVGELAGRDGPLIKLKADPRVTRVGRILRATSIDELPQLLNVLNGTMSLVGPRPAQASEVAAFDAELRQRQSVRPGMTGLWQVEARDNPAFEAYRRFDLFYIENWSLGLDLAILLGTVRVVLMRGASFASYLVRSGESLGQFALD